ncbi:DUF4179 domain-containing protein [Clostridium sp. D53t1_180928_C8]|uniref:DUF4179 domain-containing protein n=1 Tax=Clostridium sp. D53t1_180928_C8 TaxID=2787101 RepID=UPI0018A8EE82|nr:DUF4179 domain-containing protein [Clostridium sp. D53t1_180928_C8]
MSKNYFEDEKLQYENIEIPKELDFMVKKTLREGRRKRKVKIIYRYGIGIASTFLVFILLVNMFPTVAYAMSKIPGIDKLVELVKFDKGFDNAIEDGLAKEVNFEEEKNGVKLKVNTVAGDWKSLWIDYEISSDTEVEVTVSVNKSGIENAIPVLIEFRDGENEGERYIKIGFQEFNENFDLKFDIFKDDEAAMSGNYISSFNVPISLDNKIFNSELKEITLDNNLINTEIGDVEIISLKSSKTRVVMEFKLNSDKYEYMNFEDPRLVDDKGNIYEISTSYISSSDENNEIKIVELQGEIKEGIKKLTFQFDSMYYARKDNRSIIVDLKNKLVEPNGYNFEFEDLIGNELILKAENVESVSFENIILENGDDLISESGVSCISDEENDNYYIKAYLKLNDVNVDKVELKIFWIMKDKIEGNSIDLILK